MTSFAGSQHAKRSTGIDMSPSVSLRTRLTLLLPELRGFARLLVRNRSEADDLVQEALLRALRSLEQFSVRDDAQRNLRAWVFVILRNIYIEQHRRRRSETAVLALQEPEAHSVAPSQQHNAELADLQRELGRLSPALREALILVGAQGLDYTEAAEICGVPVGTMKARVSRARHQLATTMAHVALL
jgi:RNA polymerase sigma-70 factor (ECF subfamily)